MIPSTDPRDLLAAARAFLALGYVHAFGHFSVRQPDGLLITPTVPPFAHQKESDLLRLDWDGNVLAGCEQARPLEVFLHLAIYRQRPDIGAICRTHAPAASAWPKAIPPICHGFGGICEKIALFDQTDLVHNPDLGARAAAALGAADGLILRGNGVLTVGKDMAQAAARMWSLEERTLIHDRPHADPAPFSEKELEARRIWYPAEERRIWIWLNALARA